jgi:hypothetical protein
MPHARSPADAPIEINLGRFARRVGFLRRHRRTLFCTRRGHRFPSAAFRVTTVSPKPLIPASQALTSCCRLFSGPNARSTVATPAAFTFLISASSMKV